MTDPVKAVKPVNIVQFRRAKGVQASRSFWQNAALALVTQAGGVHVI